jgi:hypothetical protein
MLECIDRQLLKTAAVGIARNRGVKLEHAEMRDLVARETELEALVPDDARIGGPGLGGRLTARVASRQSMESLSR